MDCPQLLALGFLLLALAAPQPNIAMSTVGPAEGTEEYSPEVTVYRCRDYNCSKCENGKNDIEKFEKIADTKNETFPDGKVDLVTNKTQVKVCFAETISCLKRSFSICWQEHEGSGLSCGILRYGENGRGDNNTEKPVCCEAETSNRKYSSDPKCCYTEKSCPKPPAGNPGNHENSTSKMISTVMGIVIPIVIIAVLVIVIAIMKKQQQQHGQGRNQDRQSPEGENLPLGGEPSSSEETSLPAASFSSCFRMYSNRLNTH